MCTGGSIPSHFGITIITCSHMQRLLCLGVIIAIKVKF